MALNYHILTEQSFIDRRWTFKCENGEKFLISQSSKHQSLEIFHSFTSNRKADLLVSQASLSEPLISTLTHTCVT